MSNDVIQHTGRIIAINERVAQVLIAQTSACSECHAKSICGASDKKDKIIDAELCDNDFKVGDEVSIVGQKSLGITAVLLAYVMPFILIIVTMLIASIITKTEWIIGTVSLAILAPYFVILRMLRSKIQAKFKFYVTMS